MMRGGSFALAILLLAGGLRVTQGATSAGLIPFQSTIIEGIPGEEALFSIYRVGETDSELAIHFNVTGTATAGVDYPALTSPIIIPAGATNALLRIGSMPDAVVDPGETVIVTLTESEGYTVIGTNSTATATIREPGPVLFSDGFEANNASAYEVRFGAANHMPDYRAVFGFDYSAAGIAPAPRGEGTTRGLLLTVNKDNSMANGAASVNVYPRGLSFTGDYLVKFDMFLRFDESFSATTEHAAFGINHSGNFTNRHGAAGSDGVWFAVETDGSASDGGRSYVVYNPMNSLDAPPWDARLADEFISIFPSPPFQAAGAPSGEWVDVSIRQEGNRITWKIDNHEIFEFTNAGPFTAGRVMLGFMDTLASVGSTNNFVVYDHLRVISLGGGIAPETGTITITGVQRSGQNVVIDFTTTGSTAGIAVASSDTVDGTYAPEPGAQVQSVSTDEGVTTLRATVPMAGTRRFFQVRQ